MKPAQHRPAPKPVIGTGTVVTLVVLLGLLVLAAIFLVIGWETPEGPKGTEISVNGYIAMALGTLITMALGAGLMFLMFYSSRHGRD